jgi:hypothetical protein
MLKRVGQRGEYERGESPPIEVSVMIPKNEGLVDRAIRVVVGIVLLPAGLFLLDGLQGSVVGLVVAALGLLGLGTGATGWCPLYVPFGFTTVKRGRGAPVH